MVYIEPYCDIIFYLFIYLLLFTSGFLSLFFPSYILHCSNNTKLLRVLGNIISQASHICLCSSYCLDDPLYQIWVLPIYSSYVSSGFISLWMPLRDLRYKQLFMRLSSSTTGIVSYSLSYLYNLTQEISIQLNSTFICQILFISKKHRYQSYLNQRDNLVYQNPVNILVFRSTI